MSHLLTPGLQFYAEPMAGLNHTDIQEAIPMRNELYVVCQDGSFQSVHEPRHKIKWDLVEDGNEWYYRETETNNPLKQCVVRYHSRVADPPVGRGECADSPQHAEITEQKDSDDEVSSIAKIDPLLAQCAVVVGDPVQTAAMARFAKGEMSYAEMRERCG